MSLLLGFSHCSWIDLWTLESSWLVVTVQPLLAVCGTLGASLGLGWLIDQLSKWDVAGMLGIGLMGTSVTDFDTVRTKGRSSHHHHWMVAVVENEMGLVTTMVISGYIVLLLGIMCCVECTAAFGGYRQFILSCCLA